MNLDKFVIPNHVDINYIQKKYYNKYLYKLLLTVDRLKLVKEETKSWSRATNYMNYSNRFQLINEIVKDIKTHVSEDDDYRIRAENITIAVFTNSEEIITKLITELSSRVTALYRPLNFAHIDLIENHNKVLVRHSLFEHQYKFKVYLKPSWEQREKRFKEFKDWLSESNLNYGINTALNQYFNTSRSMRSIGYTTAVYFNDPEDLMMFQLRFNNQILKIEEAVLLSEL